MQVMFAAAAGMPPPAPESAFAEFRRAARQAGRTPKHKPVKSETTRANAKHRLR